MAYGYIQTSGNVARQLKDLNKDYYGRKTWEGLYDAVNYQKEKALTELSYDYNEQVAQAYKTAYSQKSAIANSMLGSGFKEQSSSNIDMALQEAFNTYKQSYLNSASKIESTADEAIAGIDKALDTEAQNYVDYQNSAYAYLQYLYDQAYPGDDAKHDADVDLQKMFTENQEWSKYIVKENVGTDNEISRLMTEQELYARNYDIDEHGEGTINKLGTSFYDQMLNQLSQEGGKYSFHNWLSNENSDLYEWSVSTDEYNYTEAGTKMGTFKKMMGLKSTDDEYDFIEKLTGIGKETVENDVRSFVNDISHLVNNTGKHTDTNTALTAYGSAITNLENYVAKLPLGDEQREIVNVAIGKLKSTVTNANVEDTSDWQAWSETVTVVKDEWEDTKYEFSQGRYGNAALELGTAVLDGALTFGTSLIMDLGHWLFPKSAAAMKNAFGRDVYKDRASERVQSNKDVVNNVQNQYLDLITLISSYVK
jgi:hypothetical protein